jgi:hypothetical protein
MLLSKYKLLLLIVAISLAVTVPVLAAAPAEGIVYEGISVPGIALGDSRAQIEAVNGPPRSCRDNNELGNLASCTYDVEGGGWVGVHYQGPNGGSPSGSPDDVVGNIRWGGEEVGWVTTAGVTTELAKYDKQAAVDAYPNAILTYDSVGRLVRLTEPDLGISISWNHAYIFYTVSMSVFKPFIPPPPPDMIHVHSIEISYTRRSVTAKVLVHDEAHQPVEGAVVGGYWVYPINKNNNTTLFIDATTASGGYATFRIDKARPGGYRITITHVVKEGYEFDYDGSILVGVITKPK